MKVNPSLIPSTAPPARPSGDVSEARRAFEALLSASVARTRAAQVPLAQQDTSAASARVELASPVDNTGPDVAMTPLIRPGRVLDIKV